MIAEVPDDLGNAWCQHVRDFDIKNPGCHFSMFAEAPDKSVEELSQMLNVQPPLQHRKTTKE
jgi:hypothetical protein